MTSHSQVNGDFERVVRLNEAAKRLLKLSFQVNLLALDAMVQSKRASLLGFDEVSSQMRRWSRELHENLEHLARVTARALAATSLSSKERRILAIVSDAADGSESEAMRAVRERLSEKQEESLTSMRRDWRLVMNVVHDLDQMGMMACVLSRSAMIEATGAAPELRVQLELVSRTFYDNSQSAADILRDLTMTLGQR
ncbi:MAG TPA: hypothetical protein VG937_11130 [Polyangiaceae bacterium]|nr:hypothetical protein [Polyangiaceae bacterium]